MDIIEFHETCGACPEAYDVRIGEKNIGWIKLRYGHLLAFFYVERSEEHPWGEETIFHHNFDDAWKGTFGADDAAKDHFLSLIRAKFIERLKKAEEQTQDEESLEVGYAYDYGSTPIVRRGQHTKLGPLIKIINHPRDFNITEDQLVPLKEELAKIRANPKVSVEYPADIYGREEGEILIIRGDGLCGRIAFREGDQYSIKVEYTHRHFGSTSEVSQEDQQSFMEFIGPLIPMIKRLYDHHQEYKRASDRIIEEINQKAGEHP